MPNYITLGKITKKNPKALQIMYDDLKLQMKSNNQFYKMYSKEASKEKANPKVMADFNAKFIQDVDVAFNKKLGIDPTLKLEGCSSKKKKKIEEDGEGGAVAGITTSSMGSSTTATGEPAPYGSSAIYADRMSMTSRGGQVGMPKPLKKKKKKKKIRESIEYIDGVLEEAYGGRYRGYSSSIGYNWSSKDYSRPNRAEGEYDENDPKRPISPLVFYKNAESKFYIQLNQEAPQYNQYPESELQQELKKVYETKEEVHRELKRIRSKYFWKYDDAEADWLELMNG